MRQPRDNAPDRLRRASSRMKRNRTTKPLALSAGEARAIALRAQGFVAGDARMRPATPTVLTALARRLGALQIDSVNVLVRSHYLPAYSRLGPYRSESLDALAYGPRRALFEYWGHEASLLPVELHPLLRWRMEHARRGVGLWRGVARFGRENAAICAEVLEEIRARGPLGVSDLGDGGRRKGGWWGWSPGKVALEWLFWTGQLTTSTRRRFERVYDLPERVLPRRVLGQPPLPPEEAQRGLLRIASRALGVATARDLRDYFRLPVADASARIAELAEGGELLPVSVEGWRQPAWLDAAVRAAAPIEARALLSPFDSLVWDRQRTERLFHFRYRLEIYTPARRRTHGYYVLPFLLGDRLVGRVDLKADRPRSTLRVLNAHLEPAVSAGEAAGPLHDELRLLARWLGLERVALSRKRVVRALLGTTHARSGRA